MTTAGILLAALAFAAQEPAIDADRPHVGTGTHVVESGQVQVEAGIQWQGASDIRMFSSPVLVRFGATDRLELRAAFDGLLTRGDGVATVYGAGNVQLGTKIRLLGERDEPWFAVMPTVNFGVASRTKGLGTGELDATLAWLVGHSLGERLHAEANYIIGAVGDAGGEHFAQHVWTGAIVHQTTRTVQTYVEAAWWSRQERRGSAVSFIDYGLIAALRPRLLIDAGAFTGVTSATPDWGVFSGVSFALGARNFHQQLRRGARPDRQGAILAAKDH